MKLKKEFYSRDARIVGKELLGKILVRKVDDIVLKGKIVETEAYIGKIDKASHAYGNKRTERTEPLYGEPGIAYVYFIYGLYYCFNVITNKKDEAEGVLIRGIEPLNEFDYLSQVRFNRKYDELTKLQIRSLTNGPSKLCMAMNINKMNNYEDMTKSEDLYIESDDNKEEFKILESKRIGIDYAEEAKDFLWRYYIKDNKYVSKK